MQQQAGMMAVRNGSAFNRDGSWIFMSYDASSFQQRERMEANNDLTLSLDFLEYLKAREVMLNKNESKRVAIIHRNMISELKVLYRWS